MVWLIDTTVTKSVWMRAYLKTPTLIDRATSGFLALVDSGLLSGPALWMVPVAGCPLVERMRITICKERKQSY